MMKLLGNITMVFMVFLLNTVGIVAHASPVPAMSHEMSGTNHQAGSSGASCVMLCKTAVVSKAEDDILINEDEEKQPQALYSIDQQLEGIVSLSKSHTARSLIAGRFQPPPGLPAYLSLGVFRA